MGRTLPFIMASCLALAGCGDTQDPSEAEVAAEDAKPIGSYTVDPETGEVRAVHTDGDGTRTTLAAGRTVDPVLPAPFILPPDATIESVTRVEQGEGRLVTIVFTSELDRNALAEFYRNLASEAGFTVTSDIPGENALVLAGENADDGTTFAATMRASEEGSEAELTVSAGIG